jgi:hypothetical protein
MIILTIYLSFRLQFEDNQLNFFVYVVSTPVLVIRQMRI